MTSSSSPRGIFIQSNIKQLIGAKVAKHALETRGKAREHNIPVTIMEVEKIPMFQNFVGKPYRKNYAPYSFDDLQSFTFTRFLPPELMHYEGRALVIDPDIFALTDIAPLIEMDLSGHAIAACKKSPWDTSVMVLDNTKLKHWDVQKMLDGIAAGTRTYESINALRDDAQLVTELSRDWNSLDELNADTKMLHTTMRMTQPWKTGLPVDFTWNPVPKLFGIIPRFWVVHPTHYQQHPNKKIETLFFDLVRDALHDGALTRTEVEAAISRGDIRKDALDLLPK